MMHSNSTSQIRSDNISPLDKNYNIININVNNLIINSNDGISKISNKTIKENKHLFLDMLYYKKY